MICIASRNPQYLHDKNDNILYFIDSDNQEQYFSSVNYIITPGKNIQEKRNDILQYCRENDIEHLIMSDDDVTHFRNSNKEKIDFIDGCNLIIKEAIKQDLTAMMLTQDAFIHTKKDAQDLANCSKLTWCYYMNIKKLPKDVLFDSTPGVFEDNDMALQLLYRQEKIATWNHLAAVMKKKAKSTSFKGGYDDTYRLEFIKRLCKLYVKWGDVLDIKEQTRFKMSPYGYRIKPNKFFTWTKKMLAEEVIKETTDETINAFLTKKDDITVIQQIKFQFGKHQKLQF